MDEYRAIRACDVCMLNKGDDTPKKVLYCGRCKAWICKKCWYNPLARAQAWMRRGLGA